MAFHHEYRGGPAARSSKRLLAASIAAAALGVSAARGESLVFPAAQSNHLVAALDVLNMGIGDLGFKKDVAEVRHVLPDVRRCLTDPLHAPRMADAALEAAARGLGADWWRLAGGWLNATGTLVSVPGPDPAPMPESLNAGLSGALSLFLREAGVAASRLDAAFGALSAEERTWLAAHLLAGVFDFEDRPEDRAAAMAAGLPLGALEETVRSARDLDPAPHSRRMADALGKVRLAELLAAARGVVDAARALDVRARACSAWPSAVVRVPTPLGTVFVGTRGDDVYGEPALLILDPAGNDRYAGNAGAANGLTGSPVSVAVDLGGDDTHAAGGPGGAGSALFGVGVLIDDGGNDAYTGAALFHAAALAGVAWAEDRGGDDTRRCGRFGQAAACAGAAVLLDVAGRDVYDAGLSAQSYAGPLATAWLVDAGGNDAYSAGGIEPDSERHAERHLSLSQGVSFGMRPAIGGGVGVLADLGGNDTYVADVYGQGVSYWYALGMLLDLTGHDTYRMHEYGQGTGIHLSTGLLFDGEGRDVYEGFSLSQGSAHDFAVGWLLDAAGDDTYTSDHFSQGRGINTSAAVLCDGGGNDA